MHPSHGLEDVLFGGAQLALTGQLMGKHVEQHFGIRVGIDVPQVRLVQLLGQLLDIGQVAVVRQGDAVGGVHVERLGLGRGRGAGGGITYMAQPHGADQALHVPLVEHIANQTVFLAQEQPVPVAGHYAGGVLAAMLQDGQSIVERLVDVRLAHYANNATHG